MKKSVVDRFWEKVQIGPVDSCWLWLDKPNAAGYGKLTLKRPGDTKHKSELAHRLMYEFCFGPIDKGMDVMHTCDNSPCVNPLHLVQGSHLENMRDRDRKGRLKINHTFIIGELETVNIRMSHACGLMSHQKLASLYGVSYGCIQTIVRKGKNTL